MNRFASVLTALLLAAVGLSGCNVLPARAPPPQLHDFGTLPAAMPGSTGLVRVDRVAAPAWSDDGAVHYRLAYADPTALRSYADQRWAAPPSDMLHLRLQALLGGDGSRAAAPQPVRLLSVELLEFEQDFPAARQASVLLVAQASLRDALDGQVLGQRQFLLSAPSTPDVQGAVRDLSKLAQQAAEQMAAWSAGIEPPAAQGSRP
ncbi:MAG TPA: ABC-type transport auxiliary lipoprotein family protein [Gammaproteobacteria bacterium]|jgi:cholesterol transport system auxiliary component